MIVKENLWKKKEKKIYQKESVRIERKDIKLDWFLTK